MKILRTSIVILVILFVFFLCLYFSYTDETIKNISLNMFTGLLTTILTVLLIDFVLKENEKKENRRKLKHIFTQYKFVTNKLFRLYFGMYKATILKRPTNTSNDFKKLLLSNDFYTNIQYLDYNKEAPILPKRDWLVYVSGEIVTIKKEYEKILEKYAFVLDSNTITKLEGIINSNHFGLFQQLPNARQVQKGMGIQSNSFFVMKYDTLIEMMKPEIEKIFDLAEYMGKECEGNSDFINDEALWNDNIAPQIGSAR